MKDHNHEGDPMSDLKYNLDASLPPRPPWLHEDEEVQILARVEEQLVDAFHTHHGSSGAAGSDAAWGERLGAFFTSGWTWAGGAVLAGAAAAFMLVLPGPSMAPLQLQGVARLPADAAPAPARRPGIPTRR